MNDSNDVSIEVQFPEKECTACGYPKPLSEFSPNKTCRDGYDTRCKACKSAYSRNRYATRPDVREKAKESVRKQTESGYLREYSKKREKTPRRIEYNKKRRASREYKERKKEYGKRYYSSSVGREKTRMKNLRRRALESAAIGEFTKEDLRIALKSQRGKCWWCGKSLQEYHADHRIPLSRGGSNDPSNIVLACPGCNLSKGSKLPHEWSNRLL